MSRLVLAAILCASFAATARAEQTRPHGELRAFFYDAKGSPMPPPADVRIYVEPKTGGRSVLRGTIVAGDAAAISTLVHHGGQLAVLRSGESIELEIVPPDVAPTTSGRQSYLRAELDLLEFACPMKCAVSPKAGDCAVCGMAMEPSLLEFDAVIAVKLHDVWLNAKGFRFPRVEAPKTLREAIDRIVAFAAEVKQRVDEGRLDRVHTPALNLSEIAKRLHALAAQEKVDDAAVAPVGERLAALGPELDQAADTGQATRVSQLLVELQSRVETVKRLVR